MRDIHISIQNENILWSSFCFGSTGVHIRRNTRGETAAQPVQAFFLSLFMCNVFLSITIYIYIEHISMCIV